MDGTAHPAAEKTPAQEFIDLWRSGACDAEAHEQLRALLARSSLHGRVVHGYPGVDAGYGQKLSSDSWKRLSWVFGPEALHGFLGKSARDICHYLGFERDWLHAKIPAGKHAYLVVFPSASADAAPASWDGLRALLEKHYPEAWQACLQQHWARICSTQFEELEAEAGYDMAKVHYVGRNPATGKSSDHRYTSLDVLLRSESTVVRARQFLYDEIGCGKNFSGTGFTEDDDGNIGTPEFLAGNRPLEQIKGAVRVDIDISVGGHCEVELMREVLPFWVQHGVDQEHGGFLCGLAHDGARVDDSKYSWYQGRGAWVFAKLYARTGDPSHLEIARQSLRFMEKWCSCPAPAAAEDADDETSFWTIVARDGSRLDDRTVPDDVGYASLFYAEGLQQVAVHEPDPAAKVTALRRVASMCRAFLARCSSDRNAPEDSYLLARPYTLGTRTLGHQMIPLRLATQVLNNHADMLDPDGRQFWEEVARGMITNITERFFDADAGLTREELAFDFSPLGSPTLFYLGHAIEAYWFVLEEADRRGDGALLELACDRILQHVARAWDRDASGGLVRGVTLEADHNDEHMFDKVAWVQQEGLVALRMVRGRTRRPQVAREAHKWFVQLYEWVMKKFPLRPHGYPLWLVGGDREATFVENYSFGNAGLKSRKENYHHPRFLLAMVEEQERERALERDGVFTLLHLRSKDAVRAALQRPRRLMLATAATVAAAGLLSAFNA